MNKTLKLKSKKSRKRHYKKIKSQKGGSFFSDMQSKFGSFTLSLKTNALSNFQGLQNSFSNMKLGFKTKMCGSIGGKKTRKRR